MKKHLNLIFCFIFLFAVSLNSSPFYAHADAITASIVGGAAFSAMNSWGITFNSGNATAQGMSDWMTGQVESYVNSHGGSIASVFGSEIAVDIAGKLVLGHTAYNAIIDFTGWLADAYDLSSVDFSLIDGTYKGFELPYDSDKESQEYNSGVHAVFSGGDTYPVYASIYNGDLLVYQNLRTSYYWTGEYTVGYSSHTVFITMTTCYASGVINGSHTYNVATQVTLDNSLSWNGADYVQPTVLNPDKEWTGTIGGQAVPDTNLDQLIGQIYEDVADNNLEVDGEVIDIPIPTPTPMPIDPDTPLSDVPWEGLDTNLTDLYEQGLEEIGAIGDAQDAITDAVAEQTGVLEGAISDHAGVVSGAIDQAVSDIQDAIVDQTDALDQSLSATAEGVETIVEALEDETINWQKFDLRGLFPFCIPFDIYNMLEALDASPTAPRVQLPFVIESIGFSYTIDLDFSAFDQVASVMRQMELIVYGLALAWATSKVIKW